MFKDVFGFFTQIINAEPVLDMFSMFLGAEKRQFEIGLQEMAKIDQQYREYFTMIFWIFYLGDPARG
jgi:hypothetical protein